MTEVITTEKMLQVLEQVVEEAGEGYVYEPQGGRACSYVHYEEREDGEGYTDQTLPGCLIGRALSKLGVSEATLNLMDGFGNSDIGSCLLTLDFSIDGLRFASEAQSIMRVAQTLQDSGDSWGFCLEKAREVVEG